MNEPYEIISLGIKNIKVNSHDVEVIVTAKLYMMYDYKLGDIYEAGEKECLEHKINKGDLIPTIIMVEACALGVSGSESLFDCLPASYTEVIATIKEFDMIENACNELSANIIDFANKTAKFIDKVS